MRRLFSFVVAVSLLSGLRPVAAAEPPSAEEDVRPGVEAQFERLAASEHREFSRMMGESAGPAALRPTRIPQPTGDAAGAARIQRLTAALSTSVEGAEAGLTVAPLAFLEPTKSGWDAYRGLNLTIAALEGGQSRLGAGYSYSSGPRVKFSDVVCDGRREDLDAAIDGVRAAFMDVCEHLVAHSDAPPSDEAASSGWPHGSEQRWARARSACGLSVNDARHVSPPDNLVAAAVALKAWLDAEGEYAADHAAEQGSSEVLQRHNDHEGSVQSLIQYTRPRPFECDGGTSTLDLRIERELYHRATGSFGLSATWDHFEATWGFEPSTVRVVRECAPDDSECQPAYEEDPPPDRSTFELARREVEVNAAFEMAFFAAEIGFGAIASRDELFDESGQEAPLVNGWSIDASIALNLSGEPKEDSGMELALGMDTTFAIPSKHERSAAPMDGYVSKVSLTPYFSVRVTEELGFRLGVPVSGELAVQTADDAETIRDRRALTWSARPTFVTVLSL
ncbi:MAG: hypothetical protein H6700_06220 [Myxococcales bacterium]|nr:hypothetical protein [Myxococcales bacterium]